MSRRVHGGRPQSYQRMVLSMLVGAALMYTLQVMTWTAQSSSTSSAALRGAGTQLTAVSDRPDGSLSTGAAAAAAEDEHRTVREVLGRGTWNMLHRMSTKYPEKPSLKQSTDMMGFITTLGDRYPCDECAKHFRGMLAVSPPRVDSRQSLMTWLCERHNEVNERLGKQQFDCSMAALEERWGDCGCSDSKDGASSASGSDAKGVDASLAAAASAAATPTPTSVSAV
eukprot:PLAT10989.1.p1 GENE.PLAT10989.1~~PLAT10989.1.p1  ORF type:complete len:226 (+),score=72.25 PLAT10989.1:22-699(+)